MEDKGTHPRAALAEVIAEAARAHAAWEAAKEKWSAAKDRESESKAAVRAAARAVRAADATVKEYHELLTHFLE